MDTVETATIKIEHDLLGAKEVPADCYYGIPTLCDEIGKQCIAKHKIIQEVVLEGGLLTQAQLDEIFSFENLVSEVDGIQVDAAA